MQRCRFCQAELDPASAICPQCGRMQPDQFAEGPTLFTGQTVGGPESSPDDTLTLPSDRMSKSLAGDPEDTFDLMLPGRMTSGQVSSGQTPAQATETPQETGAPCPACGTARRPGARFCPNCGMSFVADPYNAAAEAPLAATAPAPEPERPERRDEGGILFVPPGIGTGAVAGAPAGPQIGAPSVPTAPGWPQTGAPSVPSAPGWPQTGAPSVPSVPAGPQTGAPASTGFQVARQGAGQFLRTKLLATTTAKVVAAVLAVGVVGTASATTYVVTRPQPVIQLQSTYHAGKTPAGASETVFNINGQKFSANSSITFLIDDKKVPDNQPRESDGDGNVAADLLVTDQWGVGNHLLTASDASGYVTKQGIPFSIVHQGEAGTPGPNGAPTNTNTFKLKVTVDVVGVTTGITGSFSETLTITKGAVCIPDVDTGKSTVYTNVPIYDYYTGTQDTTATVTNTVTCSGSYGGGKLTYIETILSQTFQIADGGYCVAQTPLVNQSFEGSFTSPTEASGTFKSDGRHFNCPQVGTYGPLVDNDAGTGTWTGTITTGA